MIIDTKGKWKAYIKIIPVGYAAIGTIDGAGNGPGALAMNIATGEYVQCNYNEIFGNPLDQEKIKEYFIKKLHSKHVAEKKHMVAVNMTDADAVKLRALGKGNLSQGVRDAIRMAELHMPPVPPVPVFNMPPVPTDVTDPFANLLESLK